MKFALVVLVGAVLALAACGTSQSSKSGDGSSSGTAPSPPTDLLTVSTPQIGGEANVTAGVVVKNKSVKHAAESVELEWKEYDSGGSVVDTESQLIPIVQPTQTLHVVQHATAEGPVTKMTVQYLVGPWVAGARMGAITSGPLTIIDKGKTDFGGGDVEEQFEVSGRFNSTLSTDQQALGAWLYCTDAEGKYAGGDSILRAGVNILPTNVSAL